MAEAKYGPKREGHPSIGEECPACHQSFEVGDYTTLVLLGPGDDEEARERARSGRPYNAVALEVHWGLRDRGGSTVDMTPISLGRTPDGTLCPECGAFPACPPGEHVTAPVVGEHPSRNGSQEMASDRKPLQAGDACPVPVGGAWDEAFDRWVSFDAERPCGNPLEGRWGALYCEPGNHRIRQCARCLDLLPRLAREDARFCSTRCRVAAHRRERAIRNGSGDRGSRNTPTEKEPAR